VTGKILSVTLSALGAPSFSKVDVQAWLAPSTPTEDPEVTFLVIRRSLDAAVARTRRLGVDFDWPSRPSISFLKQQSPLFRGRVGTSRIGTSSRSAHMVGEDFFTLNCSLSGDDIKVSESLFILKEALDLTNSVNFFKSIKVESGSLPVPYVGTRFLELVSELISSLSLAKETKSKTIAFANASRLLAHLRATPSISRLLMQASLLDSTINLNFAAEAEDLMLGNLRRNIEAWRSSGDLDSLSRLIFSEDASARGILCELWQRWDDLKVGRNGAPYYLDAATKSFGHFNNIPVLLRAIQSDCNISTL
jgi:hypothetical protein